MMRALCLAFLVLTGSAPALAQEGPSPAEASLARRLFRSGLRHARAREWEQARADFAQSHGIVSSPATRLNLAHAQVELGQLVAGSESYQRVMSSATEPRFARFRSAAERALAELEPRIPRLRVRLEGLLAADVVRLDDAELARPMLALDIPVDPGEHVIRVRRGEATAAEQSFTAVQGQPVEVALDVPAPAPVATAEVAARASVDPAPVAPSDPAPVDVEEPAPNAQGGGDGAVIGVVVGLVVLALGAAAAVTAWFLVEDGRPDAFSGNVGAGVITFD